MSDEMRASAKRSAAILVAMYEQSMAGNPTEYSRGEMLLTYCDLHEMRGDFSVESFSDQVERFSELVELAKHGDMPAALRIPGNTSGAQRPSKLYCNLHYPGRSADARRAYQRDRKFIAEYEEMIAVLWSEYAGYVRHWDIEHQTLVRNAAYYQIRLMKAPTLTLEDYSRADKAASHSTKQKEKSTPLYDYYSVTRAAHQKLRRMKEEKHWIDEIDEYCVINQSEIARRLGVSRQAVSKALKRKSVAK